MKAIKRVKETEVFQYWKKHDSNRNQPVRDKIKTYGLTWTLATIERRDIKNLYIISTPDWAFKHRLAAGKGNVIDFSLKNVSKNFRKAWGKDNERALQIESRIRSIEKGITPKRLVLLTQDGQHFVAFEGNRRMIALHELDLLVGHEVYVGYGKNIDTGSNTWYSITPTDMGRKVYVEHLVWVNIETKEIGQHYNRDDPGAPWESFIEWHKEPWTIIKYSSLQNPYAKIGQNLQK